jgi:hypothetical protein
MDEATLRARAATWTLRAAAARDPRARAADLLIAAHYAALADLMAARVHFPAPTPAEEEA